MIFAGLAHHVAVPALEDLDRRSHVVQAHGAFEVLVEHTKVWNRQFIIGHKRLQQTAALAQDNRT